MPYPFASRPGVCLFLALSCGLVAHPLALAQAQTADPGTPARTSPGKPRSPVPGRTILPAKDDRTPITVRKPPLGVADPSVTVLAEEPVTVESVGLSFYPPAESQVGSTSVGGESSTEVLSHDETWRVDVRTPRTTNDEVTAERAGEAVVKQLLDAAQAMSGGHDASTGGKILERNTALIFNPERPDLIAYRAYVSMPQSGKKPDLVRGYTIAKIGPRQFVAFDLSTTQSHFTEARRAYETMVASARFVDSGDISLSRSTAVQTGIKTLANLTREDYEAAIAVRNDRWERLFLPSPTGADTDERELAYRRIRCRVGTRSELDSKATPSKLAPSTQPKPEGYIFQLDSRYLDGKRTLDTQSIFFLSFDRKDELWTIRNAVREGEKIASTTETGVRSGKAMTVQTEGTGLPAKIIKPVFETDGYLSQIESMLLPQLLIRAALPTDYGFYVYQSGPGRVTLRRDTLDQPADRPGLWKLASKYSEDAKKMQVSLFHESGELIRTELPDGPIWEPVKFERLVKLWRDKDLPMK